jgi:hypothetical protein
MAMVVLPMAGRWQAARVRTSFSKFFSLLKLTVVAPRGTQSVGILKLADGTPLMMTLDAPTQPCRSIEQGRTTWCGRRRRDEFALRAASTTLERVRPLAECTSSAWPSSGARLLNSCTEPRSTLYTLAPSLLSSAASGRPTTSLRLTMVIVLPYSRSP